MKIFKIIVLAVMAAAMVSCTTFQMSGAQMTMEMPAFNKIADLDITVSVTEWLGTPGGANLFNISSTNTDDAIYDAIQREIRKNSGDAAVNVKIEYKASFIDYLLNGLTFSIYAPAKAHITGSIVKYN